MATFITRIEIPGGDWKDYEKLHSVMESSGFSRTILGKDGNRYYLPTGEYETTGSLTIQAVYTKARTAAGRTDKPFGLLVTESKNLMWSGLVPM
jgi:hypothetical protein